MFRHPYTGTLKLYDGNIIHEFGVFDIVNLIPNNSDVQLLKVSTTNASSGIKYIPLVNYIHPLSSEFRICIAVGNTKCIAGKTLSGSFGS